MYTAVCNNWEDRGHTFVRDKGEESIRLQTHFPVILKFKLERSDSCCHKIGLRFTGVYAVQVSASHHGVQEEWKTPQSISAAVTTNRRMRRSPTYAPVPRASRWLTLPSPHAKGGTVSPRGASLPPLDFRFLVVVQKMNDQAIHHIQSPVALTDGSYLGRCIFFCFVFWRMSLLNMWAWKSVSRETCK